MLNPLTPSLEMRSGNGVADLCGQTFKGASTPFRTKHISRMTEKLTGTLGKPKTVLRAERPESKFPESASGSEVISKIKQSLALMRAATS